MSVRRQGLDMLAVHRVLYASQGGIARDLWRRGTNVRDVARQLVGVTSGHLRNDLHVERLPPPLAPGVRVGSHLRHALPHHTGHGPIVPRRAKVLRFKPKGSNRFIFRPRVRAVRGNPFLVRALPAARR